MSLPAGWLADQLPEALGAQAFTRNFLAIFEDLADGLRDRIDGVGHHIDADLAPPEDLGWLASWLAQTVEGLPPDRQRAVIAVAGAELGWRGTARWLQALLAAYTGAPAEVTDSGGVYLPGRWRARRQVVTVRLTGTGGLGERQLVRLIRSELPVDAELDLRLPPELPEPPEPSGPSEPPEPADTDWLPPEIGPAEEQGPHTASRPI